MDRKPTRPVPIPTSSKKKKKKPDELDLALASIRQVAEGEDWQGRVTLLDLEKAEHEPLERVTRLELEKAEHEPMEKVEGLEPSDYGVPKQKREEVSDEQFELDTKEIFDDNAETIGEGFYKKMARFNELMVCWRTLPNYDPNFKADLDWLEENVAHYLEQRERNIQSMQKTCPFHPLEVLKVLNPEADYGPLYCKCPEDGCPVWCTTYTAHLVLPELEQHTHPEVRAKITELQCKCGHVPRMKISRTDRNFQRIFLSCGQHLAPPCGYFQWMHAPLWKPKRPSQPTLERWQTVQTPVGEYFQDDQKNKYLKKWPGPPATTVQPGEGFRPPPSAFEEKPKSFEQLCDERNAERVKNNCTPYSYDTYRQYGLGIF